MDCDRFLSRWPLISTTPTAWPSAKSRHSYPRAHHPLRLRPAINHRQPSISFSQTSTAGGRRQTPPCGPSRRASPASLHNPPLTKSPTLLRQTRLPLTLAKPTESSRKPTKKILAMLLRSRASISALRALEPLPRKASTRRLRDRQEKGRFLWSAALALSLASKCTVAG